MTELYNNSIFWFRQDLRIHDNHGLHEAIAASKHILPIFIFDTDVLSKSPDHDKRLGFLIESIKQLDTQLQEAGSKLYCYYGKPSQIIPQLIKKYDIQALYHNKSYGYGSVSRDKTIQQHCHDHGIRYHACKDFLLVEPQELPERKVFTPFSKRRYNYLQNNPPVIHQAPRHIATIATQAEHSIESVAKSIGETNLCRWKAKSRSQLRDHIQLERYEQERNIPDMAGTSQLSPYIRFGLISIRELYQHTKAYPTYTNELAWREFRQHIAHYHPQVRVQEFQEKRRHVKRHHNETLFKKRCNGETGYPIVDAGMRQLQQENRMHGRVRMIVASFLTKDMLIDRRLGEQRFAKYLLDYDTNVNIGNRQWSASVGADPKPLRIFNPILQSQKFDPQAQYILHYIPELKGQPLAAIHDPLTHTLSYHKPIVDHYINSKLARQMYYN